MHVRKNCGIVAAAALMLMHAASAHAWGPRGHEQVADIAWTLLKPQTKTKVKAILRKGDANFKPLSQSEANFRRAFRRAANFPDVIKGNDETSFESIIAGENGTFPFPAAAPNRERVRCKTWHYFDTPILAPQGLNPAAPLATESTVLTALPRANSSLVSLAQSGQDLHKQSWYLCWIEHLVGDLHQPLHCAESFATGSGDGGGNGFTIRSHETGNRVTLHSFWDKGIERAAEIGAAGLPTDVESVTARWLEDPTLQPSQTQVNSMDINTWIADGAKAAEEAAYEGVEKLKKPKKAYVDRQVFLCKKQAVLGGKRLANMLDKALGGS